MGYAVLALVVELNSIFLHIRQLLQTCGFSKSNQYYRLNSLINLGRYMYYNNCILQERRKVFDNNKFFISFLMEYFRFKISNASLFQNGSLALQLLKA